MCNPYVPQNVLVTGGAGFIASHVAVHLTKTYPQYNLYVVDKLDECSSVRNLEEAWPYRNFEFIKGDIQSGDLMSHLIEAKQIDTVLHFAAQTHVDNSFGNSLAFTQNNTYGTHVLLEACRKAGTIKRFVNVSTDEVYGDTSVGSAQGLVEDGACLAPTNPYSAAKVGAEMLCRAYRTSYGMPIIITRGNNVFGPKQYPEKAIPKFILLASANRPLSIHGTGEAIRSYLYIDDVVSAFDCILHRGSIGEIYNIGTEEERTILQVAENVREYVAYEQPCSSPIEHVQDRAFNDQRYFIGSQKLQKLGWSRKVEWLDGLVRTIRWYLATDVRRYWSNGDIDVALRPHPVKDA